MEKVVGMEVASREEARVGGSSRLRFRGRDVRGRQHARAGRGGSVSWSEEFHAVRCVWTKDILKATH